MTAAGERDVGAGEVVGERNGGDARRAGAPRPARSRRAARWRSGCAARGRRAASPAIAAGIVADVFTTSVSPAPQMCGEIGERRRARRRRSPFDTSSRTSPRPTPRASGGSCASSAGVERDAIERRGARATAVMTPTSGDTSRDRSGDPISIERDEPGHDRLGQRAIGDVLARERVLVHLGAHVAGIDHQHAHARDARRRARRQLLERGLRRAVAAPTFVGLDRGVGRDVHDRAVRRGEQSAAAAASARAARRR